jgi:peptidoglycan/LPS O-acetylase OafA/YrhL
MQPVLTMLSPVKSQSYRPDVDGLRAIAILSVLFFHAGLGCPGGYVGVDVFFVISGYLISSLILKEFQAGKFSLVNFWERRVRRIFPALAVMVGVTLIAGWFLLLPEHLEKLGNSAIAQALLAANIYFWRTTNYFGGANDEKPLLHTWSLAVEEQFYMFFPLILVFLLRRAEFRRPQVLVATLLVGLVVSLGVAVWGVKHQPYATFFLLPTRAWELTCGALVAVLPATAMPMSRRVREGASWLGFAAICLPVCLYDDNTPFPGLAALPPCFGTALLIWANATGLRLADDGQPSTLQRLLSVRPIVFIGLISYSLYLWHWPVMAFSSYWKTAPFALGLRWGFVGVSFALAVLSWRYIETPFRQKTVCGSRRKIFGFSVASTMLVCVAGFCFTFFHGIPERLPKAARAIFDDFVARQVQAKANLPSANPTKTADIINNTLPRLGGGNASAPPQFLVWGDSHANVALPAFDSWGKQNQISGCSAVFFSTPPLVDEAYRLKDEAKDAGEIGVAVVAYVKRNKIPYTFLVAYWSLYESGVGKARLVASLNRTIQALEAVGTKVCVVQDVPTHQTDAMRVLMRNYIFHTKGWDASVCSEMEHREKNAAVYELAATSRSALFLDPAPLMLDTNSHRYRMTMNGMPLYFDKNHLSEYGALKVMLPMLERDFPTNLPFP